MKPGFALSLSSLGVTLLQRAAGGWHEVGFVSLDVDDLAAALTELRETGERHANGPIACKVVIPNDQIRYLSLDASGSEADRRAAAEIALDGATPYRVDELVFDLSDEAERTHVAAVARETLQEAEDFAVMHGFLPVSFVAVPDDMPFLGEPFFGPSQTLVSSGEVTVEPDGIAVVNIGPAAAPQSEAPDRKPDASTSEAASNETSVPDLPIAEEAMDLSEPAAEVAAQTTAVTAKDKPDAGDSDAPDKPLQDAEPAEAEEKDDASAEPKLTASAGFSTRRRKDTGVSPSLTPTPPTEGLAPKLGAADDKGKAAKAQKIAPPEPAKAATSAPVVPHAAFGAIPLSESTNADAKAAGPKQAPSPSSPAPIKIPRAPQAPAPTPVLPRDEGDALDLSDAPKDKKSLHEAGKAKLLAGVSQGKVGGKPRFLGLMLMGALLLFMAIVAVWAMAVSGIEDADNTAQPTAEDQPQEAVALLEDGTEQTPVADDAVEIAPQVSVIPQLADGDILPTEDPSEPLTDTLSSTDTAVLDALRDTQETSDDTLAEPETADAANGPDAAELSDEGPEELAAEPPADDPLARAARYAATGIWQDAPAVPETPFANALDDLYVASIDSTDLSEDAIALPDADRFRTDLELDVVSNPTAAGQQFDLDERGLVRATPEGTLSPEGVMVFLGRPEKVPPPTPNRPDQAEIAAEAARLAALSELRPRNRPTDLVEQNERAQLGGLSRAELGALRPKLRPAGLKPAEENSLPATAQAVALSVMPRARPANFANIVDRAKRNSQRNATASISEAVATVAPRTVTPNIPSSASVARQATLDNAINLRRMNLIGVYGTPSNRRALVLMPNGRYKKVKVGDRIDGGRVVAIGDSQLQYQKGNRNHTLKIPSG